MIPNDFNTAHAEVVKLVKTFADSHDKYLAADYNESAARKDFIDKFFIALGWDVNHDTQTNPYEQEVKVERNVAVAARVKKADYAFFLKPDFQAERFFVEAKRPSAALDTLDNCFQTIRYAFSSSRARLSILTNFKELYVMDCRFRPDVATATKHVHKKYHFEDFADAEKFAEVYYLFGRDAVADGSLEKYAETLPKPKGKGLQRKFRADTFQDIDDAFLAKLEEYRNELAKMFKRKNSRLTSDDLTEAVQRTLDRLVFIRFLEDKLIEPTTILDKFGDKPHPWKQFIEKSAGFNKTYNGIIFKPHPVIDSPDFAVDDKVFLSVCDDFADRYSPYHFNYIPIHILGSIYERFLGNVIVATAKQARIEAKPEVRKAGGVFYTPLYIVNYIVENTVGALLFRVPPSGGLSLGRRPAKAGTQNAGTQNAVTPADVAKMRFADIACGSGSFLLGVYEYLLRWHTKYYNQPNNKKEARESGCIVSEDGTFHLSFEQKKKILVNNVYGVDIDRQAYEVTQLSLFLKLLEEETLGSVQPVLGGYREALLPSLANNIVCGNALVDWDITGGDLLEQLDQEKEKRLNPMSFESKFPAVMRNGGFDAIVGNPPWVSLTGRFGNEIVSPDVVQYLINRFDGNTYMPNLYEYFVSQGLNLLKRDGRFSFIVPDRLGYNDQFIRLRTRILQEFWIAALVYKVPFPGIVADTLIFAFEKASPGNRKTIIGEYETELMVIPQANFAKDPDVKFRYFANQNVLDLTEKLATAPHVEPMATICSATSGFGGESKLITKDRISSNQIPVFKGDCIDRYEIRGSLWFEFNRDNITGRTTDIRKLSAVPKVLLRKTGSHLIASYDETGSFPEQS